MPDPDGTASEEREEFDLLVVGGGKAGKSLAMDRARAGERVAMVERDKIGGTCINVACIPTKTLVESARLLDSTRGATDFGVEGIGNPGISLDRLRSHKEGVVGGMVSAHEDLFADSGMDLVMGTATFVGERTVMVEANDGSRRRLRGRDVLIGTGSVPSIPDLPGIADVGAWTSESILRLETLPASLAIIGGGYIGCEIASIFASFGTDVTIIHGGEHILPAEDLDMAEALQDALASRGIDIRLGSRAASVERHDDGVHVETGDGSSVTVAELLVATGRTPATDGLGLEVAGVETDERGHITVDAHLRTTAAGVWAAGDVTAGSRFTHSSWHDFRVIRENLTGGDAVTTGRLIPHVVFTTPELARVGMTEGEAREAGRSIRVGKIAASAIPRAKTRRDGVGTWKIVVDAGTDMILGACLLGRDAGEVIAAVQMAMIGGLRHQQVRDAVITHPTMAEGLNLLLDALPEEPVGGLG